MIKNLAERLSPAPASGLYEVVWSLTEACRLRCAYCYSGSGKKGRHVTMEEARRVVGMLGDLEVRIAALSGGDPLENPEFFNIAKLVKERCRVVFVSTNGLCVDEGSANRMADVGVDAVQVSVDGDEATHDKIRGLAGSHRAAVSAIGALKSAGLDVAIAPTLTNVNVGQLDYLYDLARETGCDLSIKRVILTGRGKRKGDLQISAPDYRRIYEKANAYNRLGGPFVFLHCDPLRFHFLPDEKKKALEGATDIVGGCMAGIGVAYVAANGDVLPCSKLAMKAGNVWKDGGLKEIWSNSPVLQAFRDRGRLGGKCGACEYKNACGGCRASAFEGTDSPFGEDYMCWHNPASTTHEA